MSGLAHADTTPVDPGSVSTTHAGDSRAASTDPGTSTIATTGRGVTIGRYVVLSLLGMGGMGAVYAAYDPELERKVALKLLRSDATRADGARLLREARALAKLSHPNVVSIHDVGVVSSADSGSAEVFIAMEFVEGSTVSSWLKQRPRSVREILGVFIAAARGLAAAHAANLVHRDLKPDNMMVGDDGRTRVMDFGLARASKAPAPESLSDDTLEGGSQGARDIRLTRDGALLGTPPYMAAEQWEGREVDARTDQFAFCVSLWEALYGARPFAGKTIHAIMLAITRGVIAPPPRSGRRVPTWLRRVLERGLSTAPDQRYPNMEALLAELERGQARRRRGLWLLGLGTAGLLVTAVVGARSRQIATCDAEGATIAEVWNDAVKQDLRAALVATGVSYAGTTHDKVVPLIDAWTAEWSDMRARACREATIAGTRPPELMALTTACLDEQRDALAGLLEVLRGSTDTDVQRVVPAVAGLAPLVSCFEHSSLARRPPPPEGRIVRQQVNLLRRGLVRVQGLLGAGRYQEGLRTAESFLTSAEALGYPPLAIEARALVGKLSARLDDHERAEEALGRVYVEAGGIGADELAAEAAVQLVSTVGSGSHRPAEGLQWGLSARMLIERLGPGEELLAASLANNLAQVHGARGAYQEALRFNEQALAIREGVLGPFHPDVASTLNVRASLQRVTFAYAEAQRSHERALEIREAALGADHPDVATTLNNLGLLHRFRGDYVQAQSLLERALHLRQMAFGAQHPDVATTLNNLGVVHQLRGDYRRAGALLEQALAIREKLGSDRASLATVLHDSGLLYLARGDHARAREHLERALAIRRSKLEPGHPAIAGSLEGLGLLKHAAGADDEALALHESVLAMRRLRVDTPPPDIARALLNIAQVREARGEHDEALALTREGMALFEQTLGLDHPEAATFINALAELLRTSDPAEAGRLAAQALAVSLRTRGPDHPILSTSHRILGVLHLGRGDLDAAQFELDRALAIAESALGPDALEVADTVGVMAELARLRGREDLAAPSLDRAAAIRRRASAPVDPAATPQE